MQFISYINPRSVITAGILSFCFIENEIQRLYKNLLSDGIPGRTEDLLYLEDVPPLSFKYIRDKTVDLFTSHEDPYKLLELVESPNPDVRRKGLRLLTSHHGWKDYEYRMIAQSCSYRTIASLARIKDVDPRLFRPMPQIGPEFRNPFQGEDSREVESDQQRGSLLELTGETMFQNPFQDNESEESEPIYDQYKASLINLTGETMEAEKCIQFIREGGLGFLHQIWMTFSSDTLLQRLMAFILANLSLVEELHPQIIQGGWAFILHQWTSLEDVELYFHASRALANLDRDPESDMQESALYEDGVFLGHPVYRSSNLDEEIMVDIVFIHGLQGGPFKTWRQKGARTQGNISGQSKQTVFWPKDWLVPDIQDRVRVLNIGYDAASSFWISETPHNTKGQTMIQTGYTLLHKLKQADIGSRPVIWVGHSMGGLLIKEILFLAETDPKFKQFNKNTRGVIFYGTPHKGSTVANVFKLLFPLRPTKAVHDLMYGNKYLEMLHKSFIFTVLKHNIPCLSFGEGYKTDFGLQISVKIVESESADPSVGEFHEVPCTHTDICKPESKDSQLYRQTLSFIQRCIENIHKNVPSQEEDVIDTVSGLLRQYRGKS